MIPIIIIGLATTSLSGIASFNITTFLLQKYYDEKIEREYSLKIKKENEIIFQKNYETNTEYLIQNNTKKYNSFPHNIRWNRYIKTILIPKRHEYDKIKEDLWYNNNDYNEFNNNAQIITNM